MLNEKEKFIPLLNDGLRYYPFSTDLNMYKSDFLLSENNILDSLKILIKTKNLFEKNLPDEFNRRVELAVSKAEKIIEYDLKKSSNKKLIISIQKSILDLLGKKINAEHFWNLVLSWWSYYGPKKTEIKIKENLSYIYLLSNEEFSKLSFYVLNHTINNQNNSCAWYINCLILLKTNKIRSLIYAYIKSIIIFPNTTKNGIT